MSAPEQDAALSAHNEPEIDNTAHSGGLAVVMPAPGADPEPVATESLVEEAATHQSGGEVGKGSWIVVARVVSQAAQFLIVLLAARFMGPADFGVFALLSAIAIGLTRFSEAGWREFVMTTDDPETRAQTNALALTCGLASLVLGGLASLALLAAGYGEANAGIMAVMAIWVLLTTLSATQAGMLVRHGRLRSLAMTQIAGELAGLLAAVAVFAAGGGIFGLVAAKLAMQTTVLAVSLMMTRWFDLARPHGPRAGEAYLFSRRILTTRLVGYAQGNVAVFAIGAIVGPTGAGLFRAAGRLASALSEVISEPLRLVAWSTLRSKESGPAADRLLALVILVSTPLFVGLAVTANDIVALLLGPVWAQSAPLLVAFALAGWMNSLNALTEPLLALAGRIDILPRMSFAFTGITLACLLVAAPFGVYWIAVGQLIAAAVTFPIMVFVQSRYGGVSPRRVAADCWPAFIGGALLVGCVFGIRSLLPGALPLFATLAIQVGAGALAYLASVLLLVPRRMWKIRVKS